MAGVRGNPGSTGTGEKGWGDRIRVCGGFHVHRPTAATVVGVAETIPVLDATVDVEHGLLTPGVIARLRREVVPVGLVPASPEHDVDARPAAEHLTHIQLDR